MPPVDPASLVVLDASVAVRWVTAEVGSDEAAALLERDLTWIAPRLLVTEVASALRRRSSMVDSRRRWPVRRSTRCFRPCTTASFD